MTRKKPPAVRITPDMALDMKQLYESGFGLPKIASRYDITSAGVRYHLLKQGVNMRPIGVRDPMEQAKQRIRFREAKAVKVAEMDGRQHQTCVECGTEYAKDRRTMLCGSKRCKQQREFHNRTTNPVRMAVDYVNYRERYERKRNKRRLLAAV